jgi:chemotaxis protein MotC
VTTALRLAAPLMAAAIACAPAHGQEARAPADLIRALRVTQDRITLGDADAHLSQRGSLSQIAGELAAAPTEAWKEPRNARAAVAFVLSGGPPAILKKLIDTGALAGIDEKLARGVLAYGEAHDADALELLSAIDARTLDASIAGHVALAQAELTAKNDPKKALGFLDDARLLAPGTLIEEAALRRQVSILAAAGDFDRFETLATNYLRRFGKSVYAGAFRRQFAADVAVRRDTGEGERARKLESALEALEPVERRDIYLMIAREALVRGRAPLARLAGRNAFDLFEVQSAGRLRADVYEAAALVASEEVDKGAARLQEIDKTKLGEEEVELAAAAAIVAVEVRRMPSTVDARAPAGGDELATAFKVVGTARAQLATVDEMLREAKQ